MSTMGYDVMAAWDRIFTLQPRDSIQHGCLQPQFHDLLASKTILPFQHAKQSWSPPSSPQSLSFPSSPANSPPSSPLAPACDVAASRRISLSAKGKHSLADKLYAAACAGDLDHVQLLLDMGAPINVGTVIENLYETFKPAKSGRLSPLAGAAGHGQFDMAELLIVHGAAINPSLDQSSCSPLHEACRANDSEMARFLLELGADVDMNNCYKTTPLMYAAKHGSVDLMETLLEFAPDLHKRSFINTAAIHAAIWPAKIDVLELLLRAGANPDQPLFDGSTPLHCAANVRNPNVAQCLLKYNADPTRRNEQGKTALEIAQESDCIEVAQLLSKAQTLWKRR
ncbi:histone-lysine N-methyltransferase EHMT1-like protein [Acrodontium crateriforme]|uniref:Histone-lysine N-methyltransferase EHMT1-like protein n=1 Tax=Acrodontium crateriforme TaxID=150365 RepID=A0AAQ3LZT4_9PEZI|nr:histone-lysine N-methyltransferase EHMT1-like protein [Acrodontium crateriforme]